MTCLMSLVEGSVVGLGLVCMSPPRGPFRSFCAPVIGIIQIETYNATTDLRCRGWVGGGAARRLDRLSRSGVEERIFARPYGAADRRGIRIVEGIFRMALAA